MKSLLKIALGLYIALCLAGCSEQEDADIFRQIKREKQEDTKIMSGEHDYCRKKCE